jgi:hypothetical protein
MGSRGRVPAGLLRQVLMIGCLAAAILWQAAHPAWAQSPQSAGASAASRPAQAARTISIDDRQPPPGPTRVISSAGWILFRRRRASKVVGCPWPTRATKRSFGTIGSMRPGETARRRQSACRTTATALTLSVLRAHKPVATTLELGKVARCGSSAPWVCVAPTPRLAMTP